MHSPLLPDVTRNRRLLQDLSDLFSAMPCVQYVFVFGSFARAGADRWSDIDLLVVTINRLQFREVFAALAQYKPTAWRGRFLPQVQPSGGNVLGIVFEGESVFHNVDLNFMTLTEYHVPDALNRFGALKALYEAISPVSSRDDGVMPTAEAVNPDDWRIFEAFHFTKKAIKLILRGQDAYGELRSRSDHLRRIVSDYPPDVETPYGKIGWLAHQYLAMAESLLSV